MTGNRSAAPITEWMRKWKARIYTYLRIYCNQDRNSFKFSKDNQISIWSNLSNPKLSISFFRHCIRHASSDRPRQFRTCFDCLQAGYYCSVCECILRDSQSYLDHINGKYHNRALGMSMRVERSTAHDVSSPAQIYIMLILETLWRSTLIADIRSWRSCP